jgi:hypothetical protein
MCELEKRAPVDQQSARRKTPEKPNRRSPCRVPARAPSVNDTDAQHAALSPLLSPLTQRPSPCVNWKNEPLWTNSLIRR